MVRADCYLPHVGGRHRPCSRDGRRRRDWRILLADWNTPQAYQLQVDATLSLTLGEELAEVPAFIGEQERLALAYAPRRAEPLAERPTGTANVPAFLDLALAATLTLMQVHEAGVIHGGLSPARLLVAPDGKVRLTGFAWLSAAEAGAATDLRNSGRRWPMRRRS